MPAYPEFCGKVQLCAAYRPSRAELFGILQRCRDESGSQAGTPVERNKAKASGLYLGENGMAKAADLVSHHLHSLVGDARRTGLTLEDVTIELAAHAAYAALAYWSPTDLHTLIDVAQDEKHPLPSAAPKPISATILPFPARDKARR
jgi:hypothetical protein